MNNIYRRHTSFEMLNNTILVICIQHDFQKVHEQQKAELSFIASHFMTKFVLQATDSCSIWHHTILFISILC